MMICDRTGIIPDCMNSLLIEMRPVDRSTWTPLNVNATCIDKSQPIAPQQPPNFSTGGDDDLMLLRACAVFDPIFPMSDLGPASPAFARICAAAFRWKRCSCSRS